MSAPVGDPTNERRSSRPGRASKAFAAGKLLVLLLGSVAAATWSWMLGRGRLGAPPINGAGWSSWRSWASSRSATDLSVGVIRVAVLLVSSVLATLVLVAVASGCSRRAAISPTPRTLGVRSLDRVLPPFLRRWRDAAFAVSLAAAVATSSLAGIGAADAATRPPAPGVARPTLPAAPRVPAGNAAVGQRWPDFDAIEARRAGTSTATTRTTPPTTTEPTTRPTTTTTTPTTPATTPTRTTPVAGLTATAAPQRPSSAAAPGVVPATRTVRRGESFWSIAEDEVIASGGPVDERRVAGYWRALLEANAEAFRHGRNPNLLFPGDVIVLPSSTPG